MTNLIRVVAWSFLIATMLTWLTGCAEALQVSNAGLDAALNVIKTSCPEKTVKCQKALAAYDSGVFAFNAALLAKAAKQDDAALANSAAQSLLAVWEALQDVWSGNDGLAPSQ
jgi:hypothetical protein